MGDKLINRDLTIKILSVMLALLMWFYVLTEQNPEITKDIVIPVKLINTVFIERNSMVIADDSGNFRLTLRIKGKKNTLDKLSENTIDAYADLEGHNQKGENFLKINISGVPEGVDIIAKSAESLKILLEPNISVQKSVRLNITGNPSYGLAAMAPSMVPNEVVIAGAESKINKIKSVRVDVDIAGINTEVKRILPVRVLDESGKDIPNITIEPGNVEVSIPIENTKRVDLEMNLSGQPASGYTISNVSVQPEEMLITGKQQVLGDVDLLKTEEIDITGKSEDVLMEVKLIIPEGIEIVNSNDKVNALINIEKIKTTEIIIENLEYKNLPGSLELDSIQSPIKVSLRGAESRLDGDLNMTKFYIDLTNAVEGTNVLDILWEAPQGLDVVSVSPHQATVVLKKKED